MRAHGGTLLTLAHRRRPALPRAPPALPRPPQRRGTARVSAAARAGESSRPKLFTRIAFAAGTCDITVNGNSVMKATKGIAFGELALLQNAPRAATCTAEETVSAYALDMISFKMILMGKSKQDTEDYLGFLKAIPLLQSQSDSNLQSLASCLKEVEYPAGKNVIVEGDEGNNFYIIRTGEVKCTKGGAEVSAKLGKGDFFGELALLSSDKRAATVTTTTDTTVLMLGRAEVTRLLGPISGEIAAAAKAKRASS